MNSLRAITDFVGLSGPNRFEGVVAGRIILEPTMRSVGLTVPLLNTQERTSMRAMIEGLQRLPPISLEAEAAETEGEIPIKPVVHVHASGGVVLQTVIATFRKGSAVPNRWNQFPRIQCPAYGTWCLLPRCSTASPV
jgi:hypothetical protein